MVCTSEKKLKSDVILKTQNSPFPIAMGPSMEFRHTFVSWLRAIPSAKLKGEVIQKAAQMRQSSGSLLHASSLNRQQHKSPTTIGNHEFPLHLLRVIQVVITNKCLGLKTFIVHGCLGSKGTCLLLLAGISTKSAGGILWGR